MSSSDTVFGKRREPHTIIIAHGQSVRHFTVRPWVVGVCGTILAAAALGYLVGTTYLIMRDDILSATMARQARLQHAYEDRISSLRAQVDRITSHRLLDQQVMETKIAELANRQSMLAERAGVLAPVLNRAADEGLGGDVSKDLPIPALRPGEKSASATIAIDPATTGSIPMRTASAPSPSITLGEVTERLGDIEHSQVAQLAALRLAAEEKRNTLIATAASVGLKIKAPKVEDTATGGPLLPRMDLESDSAFLSEMEALNATLDALDATRDVVKTFPIAHPAPGQDRTSGFGNRRDPILGGSAFHAGVDFRTPIGTPIRATADGIVAAAGRNGGYGKMVEIKHANGLTTRYAHLSRIHVKEGQRVKAGAHIASSGNTGRSTGPHLHYEVRHNGKPVNPQNYLKAGERLSDFL